MPTPNQIIQQINDRISCLVKSGLADDQEMAFQRRNRHNVEIVFPNAKHISVVLKNIDYSEMYRLLVEERAYNLKGTSKNSPMETPPKIIYANHAKI